MNIEAIKAASRLAPVRLMAVMKGVRFGVNGLGEVGLSFGAYVAEGIGAPVFLNAADACAVIALYDVGDTRNLEGKPCWVKVVNGLCVFDSPCLV